MPIHRHLRVVRPAAAAADVRPAVFGDDGGPEPARWTELKQQRSYTWRPYPDAPVVECSDCGPFWFAQFDVDQDGRLVVREWHRDQCPIWQDG